MFIALIVIGLAAGVLAGLFGIGGGIIIVPALMIVAGLKPAAATGTSLGALLLPVGIFGVWEYWRNGNLDVRAALLVALGLLIGVYFGARFAQDLAPLTLRRLFAAFLVLVAIKMWFSK